MDEEYLRLLDLTTKYMLAAEAMIDGLQGKLGEAKTTEEAGAEISRRVTAYRDARRNLIAYAREREGMLSG